MAATPVIRLFGFRPTRPAFDNVVRDRMVPEICAQPGVVDAYAGRRGPDELGPRLVVSVWASREAMELVFAGSAQPGGFQPESLDGIADGTVEVFPAVISYRADRVAEVPGIIRVFRGSTVPGQLARYVKETRAGVAADVAAGHGPAAFYLAAGAAVDTFVSVSVWSSWAAIELATGGDTGRPTATRRPELIASYDATHYEAIDL
ncbi:MAG: hypothetical protein ACXW4H_07180 [Candidatus Limnocylindrales bacterium]